MRDICAILSLPIAVWSAFSSQGSSSSAERSSRAAERSANLAEDAKNASILTRNTLSTPHLITYFSIDGVFSIKNDGNGSAHIKEVTYRYGRNCIVARENHTQTDPNANIYKDILNPLAIKIGNIVIAHEHPIHGFQGLTAIVDSNNIIRSDHSIDLIHFNYPLQPSSVSGPAVYKELDKLHISASYCSDYNECYTLNNGDQKGCIDAN